MEDEFKPVLDYGDSMKQFEGKDSYEKREPDEKNEPEVVIEYKGDDVVSINKDDAQVSWEAQHGSEAEQIRDNAVFLVETFAPDLIPGLSDARNLAYDTTLGNELHTIYLWNIDKIKQQENLIGMYPESGIGLDRRTRRDIRGKIESAIMEAESRHIQRQK